MNLGSGIPAVRTDAVMGIGEMKVVGKWSVAVLVSERTTTLRYSHHTLHHYKHLSSSSLSKKLWSYAD